jgi:hypothetical protein
MRTRIIFLLLLIVCFSCGTNNKPVSDALKEKIKGEVKEVVNTIIKGAEEANFDLAMTPWLDSPDFVYINNGKAFTYKEVIDGYKSVFNTLQNQKGTIVDEKYVVLDNSTVLYTTNSKWLMNFKDGSSVLQAPWIVQFTFKKIDNKWRVVSGVESGVEKIVKASETPKELNQVELLKQLIGSWKCDYAKDTSYNVQYKLFGSGIEGTIKIVTKGKTVQEGKVLVGYDKKSDKLIEIDLLEGSDIMLYGIWFTSKTTCTEIPWEDISNPENTPVTWKYELKTPDLFVWNYVENNKTTKTYSFHREK